MLQALKGKTCGEFQTAVKKNKVEQQQMDQLVNSRQRVRAPSDAGSTDSTVKLFGKRD